MYLCLRSASARFLSGFHAFPGGSTEPADGASDEADTRARRTAVREVLEEVGIHIEPDALEPAGVWTAPPYLGVDLRTAFFLARAENLDPRIVNTEHVEGAFVRPADALARWARGEILLAPPTLHLLRVLAETAEEDALAARCLEAPEARGEPPRYARVRPHLTLFAVRTPTLPPATHTNVYVAEHGADLWVFDPASPYAEDQAELEAYVRARVAAGATVRGYVLTHAHHDHVGGVMALRAAIEAPVCAHPDAARRVHFPVDRLLADGEPLQVGDVRLQAVHTPGHDPGHLVYLDLETRAVIAGDLVAGLGTILVDPDEGSMALYLQSLARVKALEPSALLPSHGGVIGGAREKLDEYVAHRLWREGRVLDAVGEAPRSLDTLLPLAYADVAPSVFPIARMSLRAHLVKLVDEGRVHLDANGAYSRA